MGAKRGGPNSVAVDAALAQIRAIHAHVQNLRLSSRAECRSASWDVEIRVVPFAPRFAVILADIPAGIVLGIRRHPRKTMHTGLTIGKMVQGLAQFIMAGCITAWNLADRECLEVGHEIERATSPRAE